MSAKRYQLDALGMSLVCPRITFSGRRDQHFNFLPGARITSYGELKVWMVQDYMPKKFFDGGAYEANCASIV